MNKRDSLLQLATELRGTPLTQEMITNEVEFSDDGLPCFKLTINDVEVEVLWETGVVYAAASWSDDSRSMTEAVLEAIQENLDDLESEGL